MTKVCIFGASRGTGAKVVEAARSSGMHVVAAMRNPGQPDTSTSTKVVRSDVYDIPSIHEAVNGTDAVICTVGPTKIESSTNVYSQGVLNIARVLLETGPRRLIIVDGLGANPAPDLPWFYSIAMKFVARRFFGFAYRDAQEMEKRLLDFDLDWTVVRVPWLSDAPERGFRYSIGTPLHHGPHLGRSDLAKYLLSILDDAATYRRWTEVAW